MKMEDRRGERVGELESKRAEERKSGRAEELESGRAGANDSLWYNHHCE